MEQTTVEKHIDALALKAASQDDAGEAMKFAQAALNLANAAIGIANMGRDAKP